MTIFSSESFVETKSFLLPYIPNVNHTGFKVLADDMDDVSTDGDDM